jgi:class 3 adenylate cyclase
MASTRRLTAILAADMVRYSRLMGLDEAGAVQALSEHRAAADPLIADYGGRVVETTGDGLLIEFACAVTKRSRLKRSADVIPPLRFQRSHPAR